MLRKITGPHNANTNIRYSNNALIIRTKTEEAKDYVISSLQKEKITYTALNNDRDLLEKITIKGLPPSFTAEEIREELLTLEYPIQNVRQIVKHSHIEGRKTSVPLPIWVLTFHKTETLKDKLNHLNSLFCIRIRREAYAGIQGVRPVLQLPGLWACCTNVQQKDEMCTMWRKSQT